MRLARELKIIATDPCVLIIVVCIQQRVNWVEFSYAFLMYDMIRL